MQKPLLLFIFLFSHSINAKISMARMTNVQVNNKGELLSPDIYHFKTGMSYYAKGDKGTALIRLKFAAEFGHKKALRYVSLMYLEGDGIPKNNILGLAWLKLAMYYGDKKSLDFSKTILPKQSKSDLASIEIEFLKLKNDYGKSTVLDNAYKFYRRYNFQTLGKPSTIVFANNAVALNEMQIMNLSRQIKNFYIEIQNNIGEVIPGEIIPKDDEEEEK